MSKEQDAKKIAALAEYTDTCAPTRIAYFAALDDESFAEYAAVRDPAWAKFLSICQDIYKEREPA